MISNNDVDYDLFVIGAGSGGVRASRVAAQLGAKVAVAEDLYLGGTCVNVGCVPKKLYVYASQFANDFEQASGFGWQLGLREFDWATLRDNKTREVTRLNGIYGNILDGAGVTTINGRAKIVDPHTVCVNGKTYRADRILIATGGWPRRPTFEGAEHTVNSNEFFYLENMPKRVLVQGGGYIAVEFAGILNGLGCETELIYRGERFLKSFDDDVREFISEQMELKNIRLSFSCDIEKIDKLSDNRLQVTLSNGEIRDVDAVVSAIGRTPKTEDLGLENTSVQRNSDGSIIVDEGFQTHEPSIYALGDVVGRMALTPVALAEGMALSNYLYGQKPIALDYNNIATAVFCQPNIGAVGLTEQAALSQGLKVTIYKSDFKPMKASLGGSSERCLMKLIVNNDDQKVIGAHMVGADAGEIIQGIAIAIKAGATKADFDATIGIHPTAAEEFVTMRAPV